MLGTGKGVVVVLGVAVGVELVVVAEDEDEDEVEVVAVGERRVLRSQLMTLTKSWKLIMLELCNLKCIISFGMPTKL